MTSNYFDKYNYNQIQNNMFRKFRILNSDAFPRIKKPNIVKSNKLQYFPIESDKSKTEGRTIYLVTQEDSNDKKENNIYEGIQTEPKEYSNKKLYQKGKLIAQRTIQFNIFKKYKYSLNRRSFGRNKNLIYISETKSYDINKQFNEIEENVENIQNIINNNDDDKNFFNTIETKQVTLPEIENNNNNNQNKFLAYKKKITQNHYKPKIEENYNNVITNLSTITSKYKINNQIKEGENINNINAQKINKEENQKTSISKNSSLNEYLNITKVQNITSLNRSLDELHDNSNNNLIYKTLDIKQSNFIEDLNNSKIMGKNFLDGIKNQQRKIALLKAMDRYNRFKCRGRFNLINNSKIEKFNNINIKEIKEEKNEIKNNENNIQIKEEYNHEDNNNDKNNDNNVNIIEYENKEENKENIIEKDENDNDNENENEFSFNSELRKNDKKNHLEEIVSKEQNKNIISEQINNENDKEPNEIINELDNNNNNINNYEENNNSYNNNENIEKENKENKSEENINEKENEEEKEIIIKDEIENKIIKPEINISIDNKENSQIENKIIPEINISIDNKDKTQIDKNSNKKEINNSSNIINNSINININNESFNKNDIKDKKQYIPLNDIKYKNNLKPGYFIRKVVREEHYYIDENGKEKILQVKQEYINNEDRKKMKNKHPHKKKYINMGKVKGKNNMNNINSKKEKEKNENIEEIKIETIDKKNNSFEASNNIITNLINEQNDIKDVDSFSTKITEHRAEKMRNKNDLNDPLINDNLSSASGPLNYPKNTYNYYKPLRNSNYIYYNKINENKNSYKRRENENNIINISNTQTEPSIPKKENTLITINRSKNLETKTHIIKPKTKKEYISNIQLSSTNSNTNANTLINSDKKEKESSTKAININKVNITPIISTSDNYIKVNKKDKFEKPETSKKYDLNTYSINTRNIQTNKKKRESSKSHFYHEINTTKKDKDKDTDKLTSNSLSHLFNEGNDELDTSINTNKISVNSNITERTHLQRYTININTQKNYLKNNPLKGEGDTSGRLSNRFHRNNINNKVLNNSLNKDHHRYYESKSIKKNRNNYTVFNDYSAKKNYNDNNYKEYKSKNLDTNNKKDKNNKYFYSYCDIINNNSQTEKKNSKITHFYH